MVPVLAAAGLVGWWLGESVGFPPPIIELGLATGFGAVLGSIASGPGARWRVAGFLLVSSILVMAYFHGDRSSAGVFSDCVRRGEDVRAALAAHRLEHGRFPAKLGELPPGSACGERRLRGTILHYERRDEDGYALWFGNELATHEATEESPFRSHR